MQESNWRYPGWMVVLLATAAMVSTLPGRTVGLSLITEPLLADLDVTRTHYANLTLWATLVGATFSLACGPAIDRWGAANTLCATLFLLGITVTFMGWRVTAGSLLLLLIGSRGFGQSALSTASVTAIGKWFQSRLPIALGVFSALVALGFAVAIPLVGSQIAEDRWRGCWMALGGVLLLQAGFTFFAMPRTRGGHSERSVDGPFVPWRAALSSTVFWAITTSTAAYYLVLSGLTLFSEAILHELGFARSTFLLAMAAMMGAGLAGNFAAGFLAQRRSVTRLLAVSLLLLSGVLFGLPHVQGVWQLMLIFALYGVCGGAFAVLFFSGYGQAFGKAELGKIQGTAQVFGVVASALGPKLLAESQASTGSFFPALQVLGFVTLGLAGFAWFTRMTRPQAV